MKKASVAVMVLSLIWAVGLTGIGSAIRPAPPAGGAAPAGFAGQPVVPFGDDAGGSH
jgi:hypothetical protein